MTFSIAGRCPRTGMLGAVVSTSSMAVGSRCAWTQANVGAVLTQHRTDPRLGPKILARLKAGSSPETIIHDLEKTDSDLPWRQLAVIAADGTGAVFNGAHVGSEHRRFDGLLIASRRTVYLKPWHVLPGLGPVRTRLPVPILRGRLLPR